MADENNTSTIISDRRNSTEAALIGLTKDFQYLQKDITEIKKDVKDIKNDNITRREFEEKTKDMTDQISTLRNQIYGVAGIVITAVIYAVINQVLK